MAESPETPERNDRSAWVAGGIVAIIVAWMGSGLVLQGNDDAPRAAPPEPEPVAVTVAESRAQPLEQAVVAEGQTTPAREADIRAQMTGTIAETGARKGDTVTANALIARFEADERQAQLDRAREALARARRDYEQALTLLERGAGTADRVATSRAGLAAAEADMASARRAMTDTELRAPFAGRLDALDINTGEFVSAGTPVARVLDLDPLTVEVRVPQQARDTLAVGVAAEVSLITGEVARGEVRYIGASADPQTRTFLAEIEVENPEGAIAAGLSARVRIPTRTVRAHFISPAALSLASDGTLVVKAVGSDDTVVEYPVEIARARSDGAWVTGLPERLRIITIGQGFVRAGDAVAPHAPAEQG